MNTIHELNLLDNAMDSLGEAFAKYEEGEAGNQKAYKFSVLNMAHFIELIFKYHIASKHPLLIFKNPFSQKVDRSKTITLWDAVNFINNEAEEAISPELAADLGWIKKLRNDIEHHKFTMDVQQVRTTIGRLFRSVMEFMDVHSDVDIEENLPAHAKETFKVLSDEYEFSRREAIAQADQIEENTFIDLTSDPDADPVRLGCPECDQPTLVIEEQSASGYRCLFCGNEESNELPAICDLCGVKTEQGELVYWPMDNGNSEGRCYYCSGQHHMNKDD